MLGRARGVADSGLSVASSEAESVRLGVGGGRLSRSAFGGAGEQVRGLTKRCSGRPPRRLLPAVSPWRGPLLNLVLGPRGGYLEARCPGGCCWLKSLSSGSFGCSRQWPKRP